MEQEIYNKSVTFKELEEKGNYNKNLLEQIKSGNYRILNEVLDETQKENKDFMEPLLYAVKNDNKTYAIYKFYGKKLQQNMDLFKDILQAEPELIKDTEISNNREFILNVAKSNPKVIDVMSENLKSDSTFSEQLCMLNNKEILQHVATECKMPDIIKDNLFLSGNQEFMMEVIKKDSSMLKYADDNIKNNEKFIKEACRENNQIIEYIANNTNEFGERGLKATKDVLIDVSSEKAKLGFNEEANKIKEQIIEKEKLGEGTNEEIKKVKQLERHSKLFERIQNGEIDAVRAARLMDRICKNLDEEHKKEIKQLLKLDEAIIERQEQSKEEKENNEKTNKNTSKDEEFYEVAKKSDEEVSFEEREEGTQIIKEIQKEDRIIEPKEEEQVLEK